MSIKIEAVTVCVNYDDFLSESEKYNHQHFDRWVIVTSPDDKKTIELCRARNLTVVTSREFQRTNGRGKFNKGRAISLAMAQLEGDGWVLHIDADTVLPAKFKQQLHLADLDPEVIYGCDRISVFGWEDWQRFQAEGWPNRQHGYHLVTMFPNRPIGARVVRGRYGYTPIGFFQLFHGQHGIHSGMRWKDYPDSDSDAAHSDIKFSLHWDRRDRVILPEIWVTHLESEPAQMGANWNGRTTKRFEPPAAQAGGGPKPAYTAAGGEKK